MKINWTIFFSYLSIWIITGVIVFNDVIPMIIFIFCGGVCGGLILATKKKLFQNRTRLCKKDKYEY